MTEAIATDMLRSYIDRILRLKAEQDDLAADIREIYAEAKGNGYDKTGIGNVVSHVRQRDKKGTDAVAEANAIFSLYLSAYDGTPSRAHTHAREDQAASRKAPLESPGSPTAAEGLVSGRDRYVRGHATANVGQREHGEQTALSEVGESHPLKAAEDMTSRGGENPASNQSLADSEPPPSPAVAPPAMTASADQESAVPSPIVASSTPSDDDATAPRAGQSREQSPARGEIDIDLPSFLDRKSPDCIANRAQGSR